MEYISHPNATSLRNKPFPLFDELGGIFGKDRASENESASALDALEELEEEDKDMELEQVHELSIEDEGTPATQSRQIKTPPSAAPASTRTKKARTETIEALKDFSRKLEKMSGLMENASEHIGRLASFFKHESESVERRMQVTSEVMKIGGLTATQVLLASKKITLNPLEVDFFFSLPDDYIYAYVQGLLLPDEAN
ncbi:hypothetical protein POM88_010617 [Heracleum sosnowskyi]|uniref:Uncharacterized protein n=1 Tax=Heracleum sosnowskyi TaxID=360622 RepID=A0AAD8N0G8_9APIA|nr:hypothetical protein POM88_010617 [Heracleum sosnowskyi]